MTQSNPTQTLSQLESMLDEYFGKKAPALPQNAKDILVKIAPYLAILSVVLAVPAIFFVLGLGSLTTMLAPFGGAQGMMSTPMIWFGTLLLIPAIVLEGMAIPGLFSKTKMGWKYMYWSQLVSIVSTLVQFNIVGALISAVIGFYLLFQVKEMYK